MHAVFMAPADRHIARLAGWAGRVCFDKFFVVFWAAKPALWPRFKTLDQPLTRHKTQTRWQIEAKERGKTRVSDYGKQVVKVGADG